MGYDMHHVIVVVGGANATKRAHARAFELAMCPTPIVASPWNSYMSFMVPPDGSKEGWKESDEGDARRAEFKAWLRSQEEPPNWAEMIVGSSNRNDTRVVAHSATCAGCKGHGCHDCKGSGQGVKEMT